MDEGSGYRGKSLALLERAGAKVGDRLELSTAWGNVTGTLVPRYSYGDDAHVVVKLDSGYNVGVDVKDAKGVKVVSKGEGPRFTTPEPTPKGKGLPKVLVLGTGGTIASRVDYRTGGVKPAVTASELLGLIPELGEEAEVIPEILFNIFSEDMGPEHWSKVATRVGEAVKGGFAGVVVAQGTDTLGYTAAALSFALQGVPVPVVLVGAQRSPDRPSSDATLNIVAAVSAAARAPFSGVFVAMHMDESDGRIALHLGTRVRKNHTTRRDAFESVGVPVAAVWRRGEVEDHAPELPPRRKPGRFAPKPGFNPNVALLKFFPGMKGGSVDSLSKQGIRGVIVEGTGLGHVSKEAASSLRKFVKGGGFVGMTSQCLDGRVNLNVYETGRDLLDAGVVPLEDMLPETALAKLMWSMANTESPSGLKAAMTASLAGEITTRTFPGQS